MSAVAERAHLAAVGGDLARLVGDAGWRRGQALLGVRADAPASFADLARVPRWLRCSPSGLVDLARRAALIAIAPALAASIDGAWLGELADRAGEPALDRAIGLADELPTDGLSPLPAEHIDGLGFDLMRATLSGAIQRYLAWAPTGPLAVSETLAAFCVREAARE